MKKITLEDSKVIFYSDRLEQALNEDDQDEDGQDPLEVGLEPPGEDRRLPKTALTASVAMPWEKVPVRNLKK